MSLWGRERNELGWNGVGLGWGRVGRVGPGREGGGVCTGRSMINLDVLEGIWTLLRSSGKSTLPSRTSVSLSVKWPDLSESPKNPFVSVSFR